MSKLKVKQRYIFKLHTDRLKAAKWNLKLSLDEARRNEELISISDSQMFRWIDELNGLTDADERVTELQRQLRRIRRQPDSAENRKRVREIYDRIDKLAFRPDYMHLVIDKDKDLRRACNGFIVNGVKYVRLLGTSGGIKLSTVVFVSERLASILRVRLDNGRNSGVALVPAKFEAYRALACSGSVPVSAPRGVLVVPDCVTHFKEDVLYLSDENDGEPELRLWKNFDVELEESDGYGLMSPALAERWSQELGVGYTIGAANSRCAFEKGVLFAFDFVEFADRVAGTRVVKDVWGHEVDISTVELVLTTSQLKLWSSYDSVEHYLRCCEENHYTFALTKIAPEQLESRRALNLF